MKTTIVLCLAMTVFAAVLIAPVAGQNITKNPIWARATDGVLYDGDFIEARNRYAFHIRYDDWSSQPISIPVVEYSAESAISNVIDSINSPLKLLSFSQSGRFIAWVARDTTLHIRDLNTKTTYSLGTFPAYSTFNTGGTTLGTVFDADETHFLAKSLFSNIFRWNILEQRLSDTLTISQFGYGEQPNGEIITFRTAQALPFSPDGRFFIGENEQNQNFDFWDIATRSVAFSLKSGFMFSNDGAAIIAQSPTGIQILNSSTGVAQATIPYPNVSDDIEHLSVSADKSRMLAVVRNARLQLWSAQSGWRELPYTLAYARGYAELAADGKSIRYVKSDIADCSGGDNMQPSPEYVVIADVETNTIQRTIPEGASGYTHIHFSRNNDLVAYSTSWGKIVIADPATGIVRTTLAKRGKPLGFLPDGSLIIRSDAIEIYNSSTGDLLRTLPVNPLFVQNALISPDGLVLAAWNEESSVRLINLADGSVKVVIPLNSRPHYVRFNRDGTKVFTALDGNKMIICNSANGVVENNITVPQIDNKTTGITSATSDGSLVCGNIGARSSYGTTCFMYDVKGSSQVISTKPAFEYPVTEVIISPNDRFIVVGTSIPPGLGCLQAAPPTNWIYNIATKKIIMFGHSCCGTDPVAISNNGKYIAMNGRNGMQIYADSAMVLDVHEAPIYGDCHISPLPADNSATLHFHLPTGGSVAVEIINVLGERVSRTTPQWFPAGTSELPLETSTIPVGLYYCVVKVAETGGEGRMTVPLAVVR